MFNLITYDRKKVHYLIRYSSKAKKVRLLVNSKGQCVVTVPKFIPKILSKSIVDRFVRKQSDWINSKIEYFKSLPNIPVDKRKSKKKELKHYREHKTKALVFVTDRIRYWNQFYNFKFGKISVKNQRSRWGSCSSKGNMNFNYKIVFLPEELSDYIVVHELCHIAELNHSPKFWNLVGKTIPDYKKSRNELKRKHLSLS